MKHSISKQLTLLLVATLTLVIFTAAIHGYRSSTNIARTTYDNELVVVAQGILPLAKQQTGLYGNNRPITKAVFQLDDEQTDTHSSPTQNIEFAYQIVVNNTIVARSVNSPNNIIGALAEGFYDVSFNNKSWRTYTQQYAKDTWIIVAQQRNMRTQIVEQMIIAAVQPIILAMPVLALLIYLIIRRSLAPLKQLSNALQHRQSDNLSALNIHHESKELLPVISTLNLLFEKLNSAFKREREFVSHAAHELRTPLSVMKINLHNIQQNPKGITDDLPKLQDDVERMIQAVNQLLQLSKTNPETVTHTHTDVDLLLISQNVVSELYPQIEAKQQVIELIGDAQMIKSTPFLIHSLVTNLVSNANKYAPLNGHIRIRIDKTAEGHTLNIEDSGPGISPDIRTRVLERFYRAEDAINQGVPGSGLGLAIVKQVLSVHHANMHLDESDLGGLLVCITFPTPKNSAMKALNNSGTKAP